jgi:hypothetical protein
LCASAAPPIDQSIGYLEKLATNYARLSRKTERERCDLNQIVRQVAAGARGTARIETVLADGAVVDADPVSTAPDHREPGR